jgi:DNA-binding CsgD family transcriptional regulator
VQAVLDRTLEWLRWSVGCDAACAVAYDPGVLIPVSFAVTGCLDWHDALAICGQERAAADVSNFCDLAATSDHVAVLTAQSPQARLSQRWRTVLLPGGWQHELRAAAVDGGGLCWGSLTALRNGRRPFRDKDSAVVARELRQIAARLSRAMVNGHAPPACEEAASLWVSENGELLFTTPTGRDWLARLQVPEVPGRAEAILAGLAARVTTSPVADQAQDKRPVSLRLRDARGQWVALHAERVSGPGGQAHGISVVIGPARATSVLPLLAAAYGLTGREREVIRGVLTGLSTRQISSQLHITPYTVQDHLKAIFAKLGVASRGELAHYLAFQFS